MVGATAIAIWLGWQAVRSLAAQVGPPALALRVAPDSPLALSRAAEIEFSAGRDDNAVALAREALVKAPFDVRALRVLGLATAKAGDADRADEIVTLAGNWSLRDDPSHAWLIERRLRQGQYGSAFAHADTLARRRRDLDGPVFSLFTAAAVRDSRALAALGTKLQTNPPWRKPFLEFANRSDEGQLTSINLAIQLQSTSGRFSDAELENLYLTLANQKRVAAIQTLVQRSGRPRSTRLNNGGFETPPQARPFDWTLKVADGVVAEIVPDDADADRTALRLEYNGSSTQTAANQLLMLKPGRYTLTGTRKFEQPSSGQNIGWEIACLETGQSISSPDRGAALQPASWAKFTLSVEVPTTACSAQWLTLKAVPGIRTGTSVSWFDDLELR